MKIVKFNKSVNNIINLCDLERKISFLNRKYSNINYGGCGIFTYYLYKVLKYKYGVDVDVVYYPSETPPGLKPDYDVYFTHILLEIKNICIIDNNGLYSINKSLSKLSINKLEEMINIPLLWNNVFDHNDSISLIKDMEEII